MVGLGEAEARERVLSAQRELEHAFDVLAHAAPDEKLAAFVSFRAAEEAVHEAKRALRAALEAQEPVP